MKTLRFADLKHKMSPARRDEIARAAPAFGRKVVKQASPAPDGFRRDDADARTLGKDLVRHLRPPHLSPDRVLR